MSIVKIQATPTGTGTVTITAPTTNTDQTVTLPDQTGTLYISGGALGTPSSGDATNLTNLNASNLSTGTVGTARLATGTANSTTYLRGDQTWATVSTTPTTDQVLTATAGASVGAVGTYAYLGETGAISTGPGGTRAGSALRYAGTPKQNTWTDPNGRTFGAAGGNGTPAGTWRCMGWSQYWSDPYNSYFGTTLWLRIS